MTGASPFRAVAGIKLRSFDADRVFAGCDIVFETGKANKPETVSMEKSLASDYVEVQVEDFWIEQGGSPHELTIIIEYDDGL